jgi:hypothetical protein
MMRRGRCLKGARALLRRRCRAAARFRATSLGCQGIKATRLPEEATAFGLRREHVLIEIIARFADRPDKAEEELNGPLASDRCGLPGPS